MKNQFKGILSTAFSALAFAVSSRTLALDLASLSDFDFAERYAYATNRAAVIDTLRPESPPWYVYSILDAQTEGRLDDAGKLLSEFRHRKASVPNIVNSLKSRQDFLCWDCDNSKTTSLVRAIARCGIESRIPPRKVELPPDAYPSALDPKKISYAEFARGGEFADYEQNFAFLRYADDGFTPTYFSTVDRQLLPDSPGFFAAILSYLKDTDQSHVFRNEPPFSNLTLSQLETVLKETKGLKDKDVSKSSAFVDAVLSKISAGADDDPDDMACVERSLLRRVDFSRSIDPEGVSSRTADALKALLSHYASLGDYAHKDVFAEYLAVRGRIARRSSPCDDFVREWLLALRFAGDDIMSFSGFVDSMELACIAAEADLLSGRPAHEVNVSAILGDGFKRLQERVELSWAKSNPAVFPSDGDVSLAIDVKNVPQMRVAIYVLDAFEACKAAKGEVPTSIDLDCAVPNVERIVEYKTPGIVRHRETLSLPELKEPGLYVVECSGGGVSSRAFVRKGHLRATVRHDAGGYVIAAIDEKGGAAKGAKVWLDGTSYVAGANGEVAVPFAPDARLAGEKTAVVGAGRLATTISFSHLTETVDLALDAFVPPESIVAGCEAVALIRPRLSISGMPSSLSLLEGTELKVETVDQDRRVTVRPVKGLKLSDDAECEVRFTVPKRLYKVSFSLGGSVRLASTGKDVSVSASKDFNFNGISETTTVEQLFLRKTSAGHFIEMRGRTGESVPHRALPLRIKHRAFGDGGGCINVTLQGDANGVISLGALEDIEWISTPEFGGYKWDIVGGAADLPRTASLAEGESLEIPVRGLLEGKWPGADKLSTRVSLLALNKSGRITADCIGAVSYENGVLKADGLPAGDYRLTLRAEGAQCLVRVARTEGGHAVVGGVVASAARSIPDTGSPGLLRVDSAALADDGTLAVRLANAGKGTRVHVVASRNARDSRDGNSLADMLTAGRFEPEVRVGTWATKRSGYISERDLGDELRYVFDRRRQPGRIGNMLQRPSLILNPWATVETDTKGDSVSAGRDWDEDSRAKSARAGSGAGRLSAVDLPERLGWVCRDFMPGPARVFANLRPAADGSLSVNLEGAHGMQDIEIVATDGDVADAVRICGAAEPYTPRDLRMRPGVDPLAGAARTKSFTTVREIFDGMRALKPLPGFDQFSFVADWGAKSDEEKRALYGKFACHELDFFLHEKDPAFFAAVVAPNLRNKRFPQFVDKWLLGEDVSEWARPGKLQDLNAFEQCLLAIRVPSMVNAIARTMEDECKANPISPDLEDFILESLLGEFDFEGSSDVKEAEKPRFPKAALMNCIMAAAPNSSVGAEECESDGIDVEVEFPAMKPAGFGSAPAASVIDSVSAGWSGEPVALVSSPVKMKSMAGSRNAVGRESLRREMRLAVKRRAEVRTPYRPPERTREWVETHYWRMRHAESTVKLAGVNRCWRDLARAIADGKLDTFRSPHLFDVCGDSFAANMFALAFVRVGFEPCAEDKGVVIGRGGFAAEAKDGHSGLSIVRRVLESEKGEDGELVDAKELVKGRVYTMKTVVVNATPAERRLYLATQIPSGAIALSGCRETDEQTLVVDDYSSASATTAFYFPYAGEGAFDAAPAVAVEGGVVAGQSGAMKCEVLDKPSDADKESWSYISQSGTKGAVLAFLEKASLANVDLEAIGWRFVDGDFARKALAVLERRGAYSQALWLAGMKWLDAFDPARVREALSKGDARKKLANELGPCFKSSLVEIEPEETDIFEHREYWPIINARVHAKGAATEILNKSLAGEYRRFLDMLAAKRGLDARDRLLAAVYLLAQDRVEDAAAMVRDVRPEDVSTKMQLDYMKAYLAFCEGRPEDARKIASAYADYPVALWRDRFAEVVLHADEAAGRFAPKFSKDAASRAPSVSIAAYYTDGSFDGVMVRGENVELCAVKVYPVDVEIAFSKNPFSQKVGGSDSLRPAWEGEVRFSDGKGKSIVRLPKSLLSSKLLVVATAADGRAEDRTFVTLGSMSVQVVREYRQIRVRGAGGKPLPGAYVKVYARDEAGASVRFHKDGYTDLRGAFDYASISSDSEFKPAEYAIFVSSAQGVFTECVRP